MFMRFGAIVTVGIFLSGVGHAERALRYTGPRLDGCIGGEFSAHDDKFLIRNTCQQALLVQYQARNRRGRSFAGVAIVAPGEVHYTGDRGQADLNAFGGYEFAACPRIESSARWYLIAAPDSSNQPRGFKTWKGGPYVCVDPATRS